MAHDTNPSSDERPGTRDPRRSRVRALKVLFQADVRGQDPSLTLASIATDPAAVELIDDRDDDERVVGAVIDDYARRLVDGVAVHRHALDEVIGTHAHRWDVHRMPRVDRNILRLATWEMLHERVGPAVVINEALELAKELSTQRSHTFINGVLEAIRRDMHAGRVQASDGTSTATISSATHDPAAAATASDSVAEDD